MNKQHRVPSTEVALRHGDGFEVTLTEQRRAVTTDGHTVTEFGFQLADAPAPDRRYVADVFALSPTVGGYRFCFAQEKIGTSDDPLRSLVLIYMSHDAIKRYMESTAGMIVPRDEVIHRDIAADAPTEIKREPDQTVLLKANAVAVAFSNEETAMDFYQVSPFSVSKARNGGKLQISPVVRIELRTGQFLSMLEALGELGYRKEKAVAA